MNKNDLTIGSCFGISIILIVSIVLGAMLNGWVFSILWKWFVIPIFNLPALTVVQSIGLGMVVAMFNGKDKFSSDKKSDQESLWTVTLKAFFTAILTPLFTLLLAYIVTLFL